MIMMILGLKTTETLTYFHGRNKRSYFEEMWIL